MSGVEEAGNSVDGESAEQTIMDLSLTKDVDELDVINNLNDDCLSAIFSYLLLEDRFTIQTVCKRWRENHHLVWRDMKSLDLTSVDLLVLSFWSKVQINALFERSGPFVQYLKVGFPRRMVILPLISAHCHNLKRVEMALGPHDVIPVDWFAKMEKLEYLKMGGSTQHFSQMFFHNLPHEELNELHLSVIPPNLYLSPMTASELEKFTKLSALTMDGFLPSAHLLTTVNEHLNLSILSLAIRVVEGVRPDIELFSKVTHLNLSGLPEVDTDSLKQISKICKNLKYLDISGCENVFDDGIAELQKLSQIEQLNLNHNCNITDEPLSRMHNLRKLECLDCFEVQDDGIITLIKYAPILEYLNLRYSGVTAKILTEASEIVSQRTNNIELDILVDDDVIYQWNGDCPALLNVNPWRDFPSYYSDSTDSSDQYGISDSSSDATDSSIDITDCSTDSTDTIDIGDAGDAEVAKDDC